MKTLSMIFWFYHLPDINLSINLEIEIQKRKDGGLLTAEHRSGSRNQWLASPPLPQAALTNLSYSTLHNQLSVHLSLYLSTCSFCSPTRTFQRNPGLTCLPQQYPECPDQCLQAVTAQCPIRAWVHNSTLLFYRLPQSSLLLLSAESTTKSHHWVLSPMSLFHVYGLQVRVGAFRGCGILFFRSNSLLTFPVAPNFPTPVRMLYLFILGGSSQ